MGRERLPVGARWGSPATLRRRRPLNAFKVQRYDRTVCNAGVVAEGVERQLGAVRTLVALYDSTGQRWAEVRAIARRPAPAGLGFGLPDHVDVVVFVTDEASVVAAPGYPVEAMSMEPSTRGPGSVEAQGRASVRRMAAEVARDRAQTGAVAPSS